MQFGPEYLSKIGQFLSDADAFLAEDGGGGQGRAASMRPAESQLALLMEVGWGPRHGFISYDSLDSLI